MSNTAFLSHKVTENGLEMVISNPDMVGMVRSLVVPPNSPCVPAEGHWT